MHRAVKSSLVICAGLIAVADQGLADEHAPPLTEDECRAVWNTGAGRSGFFGPDGAKPYIDSFEAVDTNRDKQISNAEFKAGCAAGLVHKFRPQS